MKIKSKLLTAVVIGISGQVAHADDTSQALIDSVGANMTLLPANSPATVTVITRNMIKASGAQTLADAIALAPGMIVGSRTAGQQSVSYLGMSDEYARRLQVLVNGQSIYTPTTGGVNWAMIPVPLSNVSRIEILHGPGSAVHGENAMMATINIVTVDPALIHKARAEMYIDNRGQKNMTASASALEGPLSLMATINHVKNEGTQSKTVPFNDAFTSKTASIHSKYSLANMGSISLDIGATRGQEDRSGYDQPWTTKLPTYTLPYTRYYSNDYEHLQLALPTNDGGQVKASLSRVSDEANYSYLETVGKLHLPVNSDYSGTRTEFNLDYNKTINNEWTAAVGGGLRRDRLKSTYFIGDSSPFVNDIESAYAGLSWSPTAKWTFNGEANVEHATIMSTKVSPTMSANYHLDNNNTFRLGYATGFRMPMTYEAKADRTMDFPGVGNVALVKSLFDLMPENNRTIDAAWQYESGRYLSAAARVFHSRLTSLVNPVEAPYKGISVTPGYILSFQNAQGTVKMDGAEAQLKWQPGKWLVFGTWTITNLDLSEADPSTVALYAQSVPKDVGSLLVSYDFGHGITASVTAKHLSSFKWAWVTYPVLGEQNVIGAKLQKAWRFHGSELTLALIGANLGGVDHNFRTDAGAYRSVGLQANVGF